MLAGHVGTGLALHRLERTTSPALLVTAALALDLLLWPLVLAGVEWVEIPADYERLHYLTFDFPFSHSLVAALAYSFLGALAVSLLGRRSRRAAALVGLALLSHFVLDAVVHVEGLPLAGRGSPKIGLGWWSDMPLALTFESVLTIGGVILYSIGSGLSRIRAVGVTLWVAAVLGLTVFGQTKAPPPPVPKEAALTSFGMLIVILAVLWALTSLTSPTSRTSKPRQRSLDASERGFSLLEALLALTITLIVMALVAETMASVARIHRFQTDFAVSSASAGLAIDDIASELALAGQGLGEGPSPVAPRLEGTSPSESVISVRSNPELVAFGIVGDLEGPESEAFLTGLTGDVGLESGDRVIVTDVAGGGDRAQLVRSSSGQLTARSEETSSGRFRHPYTRARGARALGLREVRYYLEGPREDGRNDLVKEVVGVNRRVLSRDVLSLSFDYRDAEDEPISLATVESSRELASVRVRLKFLSGEDTRGPITLATRVALSSSSATVDFERHDLGFRLSRVFYPIDSPAGAASRIGAEWGVLLASGKSPTQDPAYLYTFELEKGFQSASVDEVVPLEDVRAPVTLAFGPERGPLAGSLFVAAWGLRIGHLARIAPNAAGRLSTDSVVTTFEGTEAIAQAGGIAFGADDALYVTSQEKGAIYRFRFRADGTPERPELLFRLTGTPGALVEGSDGHLYFVMNRGEQGSVWKMEFDETLKPSSPVLVRSLSGLALSLARDPVGGNLFALSRTLRGDFVVQELDRSSLREPQKESASPAPPVLFSLREWRRKLQEGDFAPREIPFPLSELPRRFDSLDIEEIDSISFDEGGSLYVAVRKKNVVLKFELDRPSGRYAVGLAAGVVERGLGQAPVVRMHAWKKSAQGF